MWVLLFQSNGSLTQRLLRLTDGEEHGACREEQTTAQHLDDVAATGRSGAAPIDRTYPLSEAAAAHAYIESRKAFGRVLLIP